MEVSPKIYYPVISLLDVYPEDSESSHHRDTPTSRFIAALSIIAVMVSSNKGMGKEHVGSLYSGIFFSHKKERSHIHFVQEKMGTNRADHAK